MRVVCLWGHAWLRTLTTRRLLRRVNCSDRVMEDVDMRARERETVKDRVRGGGMGGRGGGGDSLHKVKLDVLGRRG